MAGHAPGAYRDAPPRPAETTVPPVVICGACGVGAAARLSACGSCGADLATHRRHVPAGALVWCALKATFQCRSCAFHSPLDGVELDRGVHCAQCGAFQKFAAHGWEAALAHAHAIADLAGPTPEGRFPSDRIWIGDQNPHRGIGVDATFSATGGGEDAGGGALPEVEVGRGHPVCRSCKQPFDVAVSGTRCETRCRGCGSTASYELPREVQGWAGAARAVVAPEHRLDQKCVRLQQQAGGAVVALLCPHCGAPLRDVRAGSVRCSHCGTSAHVPARARPREGGALVEAEPFFVAFHGPSAERERLERPRLPDATIAGLTKAKGLMARGLTPLAGIALPPTKPGTDVRQLGLTLGLAAIALAIGFALVAAWNHLVA